MQAMLLAMQVALGAIASIPIGDSIRISFGYLASAVTGALLGPVPALLNGMLADILGFLIKPTGAYHPGFTLSAMLGGMIYGLTFYRRDVRLKHILVAKLAVDLLVNLTLNTLWINQLYGKAFWVLLPARLLKNLAQYPVDICLLYPVMKALAKIRAKGKLL